jgi:hypothetical protein
MFSGDSFTVPYEYKNNVITFTIENMTINLDVLKLTETELVLDFRKQVMDRHIILHYEKSN